MNKKDCTGEFVRTNPGLLACPVCKGQMRANGSQAIECPNRHSFDVASSGYINLLTSAVKTEYGADMLESRNKVCRSGFFDGLISEINGVIMDNAKSVDSAINMLDAGCGEGSQLARIRVALANLANVKITAVGVDISREGIRIAARDYPGILWLVADLARLPVSDGSLDIIINILSPSNYSEFSRALTPGGLLIKVVPGDDYLKELREIFFDDKRREYSGERVESHFSECFRMSETRKVRYSLKLDGENLKNLIKMTPLSWSVANDRIEGAIKRGNIDITADFNILVGKNQTKRNEN